MSSQTWRQAQPMLAEFIDEEVDEAVDNYGRSYLDNMGEAWSLYGLKGVETQLLYIANNLKPGYRKVATKLEKWSYRLKEHRAKEEKDRLSSCEDD